MATAAERDDHVRVVEAELASVQKSVPTPGAAPQWQPVTGVRSDGGDAAQRTIRGGNTHKA
jgi:hypothetical protein